MRTSISNANMCQPGADYVCDWKPLDNALHASSFLILSSILYIYIYVKTRRRACSNYGKMNAMRFVGWDVLLTWFGIYTFFFSLFFLSNANRVSPCLSLSPFFLSWLVTAFPCRRRSNYRNGPTSLLSPLFFFLLARSPRALSFLVSVASSFAFFL